MPPSDVLCVVCRLERGVSGRLRAARADRGGALPPRLPGVSVRDDALLGGSGGILRRGLAVCAAYQPPATTLREDHQG